MPFLLLVETRLQFATVLVEIQSRPDFDWEVAFSLLFGAAIVSVEEAEERVSIEMVSGKDRVMEWLAEMSFANARG